jgi:hypothetical protein
MGVSRRTLVLAALSSSIAILIKQSYISAPLAIAAYLCMNEARFAQGLRRAIEFGAVLVCAVGAGLVATWLAYGPDFLYSIFVLPVAIFDRANYANLLGHALRESAYAFAMLCAIVCAGRKLRSPLRVRAFSVFDFYLLTSLFVMLATMGKVGAWLGYLQEPMLAGLIVVVSAVSAIEWNSRTSRTVAACVALAIGCWTFDHVRERGTDTFRLASEASNAISDRVIADMRSDLAKALADSGTANSNRVLLFGFYHRSPAVALGLPIVLGDYFIYQGFWLAHTFNYRDVCQSISNTRYDLIALPKQLNHSFDTIDFKEALARDFEPMPGSRYFNFYRAKRVN